MKTIRKALTAGGFAAAAALGTALLDGDLTRPEVLASAGMGLVAGAATWRIRNAPKPETPPESIG